jgi:hypothetical protein
MIFNVTTEKSGWRQTASHSRPEKYTPAGLHYQAGRFFPEGLNASHMGADGNGTPASATRAVSHFYLR